MIPLYPKSWQRAAIVATIAAILAVGLCAWAYTVDDAFIVARYAARWASGHGYTFNPGPPTDGVTGPLWILPGWLASVVGLDPVDVAKVVGLCCTVLACALLVQRLTQRARGTYYACAAAVLLALQPTLGGWAVAGLETGAATLALTIAVLALTARPHAQRWRLGVALGVLPWLRPELLVAATVVIAAAGVRIGWKRAIPVWALAGLGLGALLSFRYAMFGSLVPLVYHAKQGALDHGVDYAIRGACIVFGLFGVLLLWRGAQRGRWDDRFVAGLVVAHVGALILAGGDWMPGFRLFAPIVPVAFGVLAVGAVAPAPSPSRLASVLRAVTCAGVLAVFAVDLATRIPEWRASRASRAHAGRILAERLRSSASRVALVDIGFLAYASGVEVVDLGGITDPEIARLPGGHLDKVIPDTLWAERNPDALLLHSASPPLIAADGRLLRFSGYPVERRLAAAPWVSEEFRVAFQQSYAPHYHYVLLLPLQRSRRFSGDR